MEIAAPPAAVFAWLADPERRLEWLGALVECEPLWEGPPAVGSRYLAVSTSLLYGRLWTDSQRRAAAYLRSRPAVDRTATDIALREAVPSAITAPRAA